MVRIKHDRFYTGFKITVKTGIYARVFVLMVVKRLLCHSKLKPPKINRKKIAKKCDVS